MQELIKEISEMKWEMKYISKTLSKVEKVLENQAVLLEKQSVANKRILDLEAEDKEVKRRIKVLEDWKNKIVDQWTLLVTIASWIATVLWFIINKFFD